MSERSLTSQGASPRWGGALPAGVLAALVAVAACGGCATLLVTGAVDPNEAAQEAVEIAAAVTDALVRDGGVDARDIRAVASGSVVTLNGSVPSGADRDRAVAVAAGTSGVSRVVDRLSVDAS